MPLRRKHCAFALLVTCACGSSDPTRYPREEGGAGGAPSLSDAGDGGNTAPPDGGDAPTPGGGGEGLGGEGGEAAASQGCPPPTGEPVLHQSPITADETWDAGLHDVTFDIHVQNSATLTIEPCAVVRVVASRGLQVRDGRIVAKGTAEQPIVFQGLDGATWGNIEVDAPSFVDLAYVTIEDAGDPGSTRGRAGGALHLLGSTDEPLQELARVDHVTLDGAVRFGAVLEMRGGFSADSDALTITGSGEEAMWVSADSLGTIPPGDYAGNTVDAIRIWPDTYIDADETIYDRGVPYIVGGDGYGSQLRVHGVDDTLAVLTVEPGVTLKFPKSDRDSALYLQHSSNTPVDAPAGALVALGTEDRPIVLTSNEDAPAAGDWIGVWFEAVSEQSRMDYVQVEYAGGDTGTDNFSCGTPPAPTPAKNRAAIAIFSEPATEFVTHTTISDSAWNGFERAWTNGVAVDFLPTNSFVDVQYCAQTYPRQEGTNPQCPDTCER